SSPKNLDLLDPPGDSTLFDHPTALDDPDGAWEPMELCTSVELRHDLTHLDTSIRDLMGCRVRAALRSPVDTSLLEQLHHVQRDAENRARTIKHELDRRHPYSESAQRRARRRHGRQDSPTSRQAKLLLKSQKEGFVQDVKLRKEQFRARRDRHAALLKSHDFFHDYQTRVGEFIAYLKTSSVVSVDTTTPPPTEDPAGILCDSVAPSDRV
ncbi:hypothetical protein BGW38_009409, partial [Lunasporangiospora selenospora]